MLGDSVYTVEEKNAFIGPRTDMTRLVLSCFEGRASLTKQLRVDNLFSLAESIRCKEVLSFRYRNGLRYRGHCPQFAETAHLCAAAAKRHDVKVACIPHEFCCGGLLNTLADASKSAHFAARTSTEMWRELVSTPRDSMHQPHAKHSRDAKHWQGRLFWISALPSTLKTLT